MPSAVAAAASPAMPSLPRITPSASAALVLCLEEFLRVLAAELLRPSGGGSGSGAAPGPVRRRISTGDVGRALAGMGLADLLAEANDGSTAPGPPPQRGGSGPSRSGERPRKRRREFSREQAEEQERLLAASKRKMAGGDPTEAVQNYC